ncbi:MAG: zinc transporter ZupT [Candidatus Cloacimonadia bacterium]
MNNVLYAFLLTLGAGLATGIGSVLAFFTKRTNTRFLSIILGFSAGVMIFISLVEIYVQSQVTLVGCLGQIWGSWAALASFLGGIFLIGIIDKFVPEAENPHAVQKVEEVDRVERKMEMETELDPKKLHRMGLFTALAITIHNFPEGLATFVAALKEPTLGLAIAVAIALHNIPEGIAVSIPIYYATGSKKRAFIYSFLSGLAEPLGAIVGYLILMPFMTDTLFGVIFGMVGGIMVYISFDELLPSAQKYGEHHLSIYGLVAGMVVMAVSMIYL